MPLGLVKLNEFEREVNRLVAVNNRLLEEPIRTEVKEIEHGRGLGKLETPPSVRALIATEALVGVPSKELSETFGVSPSSVSAYKNGATSTSSYHEPDPKLKEAIDSSRDRIIGPAQSRLIKALEAISDEKLNDAKVSIASGVARDMSTIIKNLQPDPSVIVNQNKVIVFRPRQKEEDDYESIVVDE